MSRQYMCVGIDNTEWIQKLEDEGWEFGYFHKDDKIMYYKEVNNEKEQ